jgi:hypothetical protein
MRRTPETLVVGGYDASKIRVVLDAIIAECMAIAVDIAAATGWEQSRRAAASTLH